jgi:sec-independent protein translocase protein TatC
MMVSLFREMAVVPFSQPKSGRQLGPLDGLLGDVSILERLDDFRKRIVRSLLAIAFGALAGFLVINRLMTFLLGPTRRALPAGTRLIYTEPGEAFGLYIQVALIAGVVFAMPFVMYQLWRLIQPLVPSGARRYAIPFVLFTSLGFVAGAAFTHYIAFPYMMVFFASFNTPDLRFMPKLDDVFDLYTKMVLGMAIVFQMPTVVFFLSKVGLVTAGFLWRSFRYAFLLIFIAAAVITPTGDMVTQTIFAAPMVALYLLSIAIAAIFGRVRPAASDDDAP